MSKVLVLTDRHPEDTDWKGAFAWQLILDLAQSQHEVLAITTIDPLSLEISHPRLTIAHPCSDWRADRIGRIMRTVLTFQPDVVHSFAFHPSRLWPSLTVWPYLSSTLALIKGCKRYSVLFESSDLAESDPSLAWFRGSQKNLVFSGAQVSSLSQRLNISASVLPMEFEARIAPEPAPVILIPAPISDLRDGESALRDLTRMLTADNRLSATFVGGWGDWPASRRREGWQLVMSVADRVRMVPPLTWRDFLKQALEAQALWLEYLPEDSWRRLVALGLANSAGLNVLGSQAQSGERASSANYLSRLYANSGMH
jgi:hypothetical protein